VLVLYLMNYICGNYYSIIWSFLVKIKNIFISILFCLVLSSCTSTEQNKDDAADQAREFIFDKVEHISTENTMIIKYTYPRILKKDMFLTWGQEYNQYYFAWDLKNPKVTVMVFGTSHKDLRDWNPIRIVFKEYDEEDYGEEIEESTGVWAEKPTIEKNAILDATQRGVQ
jgi:hypothetical protein